ncbi:hypothetical protein EV714DRAFT_268305 [Schizophyllum commune]
MEHFECYWGLKKGELELSTSLNHIQLRSDMVRRMDDCEWTLLPTKKTLKAITALSDFNTAADASKRKRFTEDLPAQEYEYEFLPMQISKRDCPSMYLKRGSTTRTIHRAYSKMPRIKTRAHPLFVIFRAFNDIVSGSFSMPDAKVQRLTQLLNDVLRRWEPPPPVEFLVGPDVWAEHRHPSSDDGSLARAQLVTCDASMTDRPERDTRRTTGAPSPQPKSRQDRPSVYDYLRQRPPRPRSPALPRSARASEPASSDSERGSTFSPADLHDWLSSINPKSRTRKAPPPSPRGDAVLARYRKELARDPAKVRLTTRLNNGGLVGHGNYDNNRSAFTSNDWARHTYKKCLWSSDPPRQAVADYVSLVA